MPTRQLYQTTVFEPGGAGEATFLSVPASAFKDRRLLEDPPQLAKTLGARQTFRLQDALEVWPVLAVVLAEDATSVDMLEQKPQEEWLQVLATVTPSAKRGFASYCATAALFAFEESPVTTTTLLSVIGKASPSGLGATIGFIVAGGATPLALVLVPTGMIVFGTAAGIARGLQIGLEYKIKALLGVPQPELERASSPTSD